MVTFRGSINALKEAGLTDSEILEIITESVDRQMYTKLVYMNFQQIIAILMLRQPHSVNGRRVPSAQRNTPNRLGKVPQD